MKKKIEKIEYCEQILMEHNCEDCDIGYCAFKQELENIEKKNSLRRITKSHRGEAS